MLIMALTTAIFMLWRARKKWSARLRSLKARFRLGPPEPQGAQSMESPAR
jgi:hypothetical protein